ncbi:MAG: cytochrome d ubiquinol oxidase subunit II [Gammaproteobacteria bacterium]|nr:cytochrome d ubiquinol oxidase subunit II [Gammaproteobacteria bacterium]
MAFDLPTVWAGILVLAVFLYVLLDGFDLGVGILYPFAPSDEDRDVMMDTLAPVWDGNETWLVLGGGGLFAAFPLAYSTILPALYMPIGFMLTALIFRGVSFEFRGRASGSWRRFWDHAFHLGSLVAAFAQGLILGGLVQGLDVVDGRFAGGTFDWLTPFSFLVGCALVWGYALLGATWLIVKTEGDLLDWARRVALPPALVTLAMMAVVGLWTPLLDPDIAARWGLRWPEPDWSRLLPLAPIPLLVAAAFGWLFRGLRRGATYTPYLATIVLFGLGYVGLLVGIYPYIVPYAITVHEAAAAPDAQAFLLAGTLILLPMVLGYTVYVYWTFRGKVRAGEGYH